MDIYKQFQAGWKARDGCKGKIRTEKPVSDKTVRIQFKHWWRKFSPTQFNFLRKWFNIKVVSEDPDCIIFSCYQVRRSPRHSNSLEPPQEGCTRIFVTNENIAPDMNKCEYAVTFSRKRHPRHFRIPYYTLHLLMNGYDLDRLIKKKNTDYERILAEKKEFCCFIVTNGSQNARNIFFQKLNKYKKVHSAGRFWNNVRFRLPKWDPAYANKLEFLKKYKFVIAFENVASHGYITEKLVHGMLTNTLPIYWGDPMANIDFNTKSFIWHGDYIPKQSPGNGKVISPHYFDALIDRIIEVDQNDQLYLEYMQQPWLPNNQHTEWTNENIIQNAFYKMFS